MDDLIQVVDEYSEIQFIVSLDYCSDEEDAFSCNQWADLYTQLGQHGNNPLILNTDPDHKIWNMFAGSTYSAYAFIDHNMVLRYKFDMPNLYDFQYTYIPALVNEMYGCLDSTACNYNENAVYDDGTCQFDDQCNLCADSTNQLDCMSIEGCMWMGDHCMQSTDNCMNLESELDCINAQGCYWMGDHCMTGSNCTDPIAFNYNPTADNLGAGNLDDCQYSSFIDFGCTYIDAINYNQLADVDDGSCQYTFADINNDGIVNILDIVELVSIILD